MAVTTLFIMDWWRGLVNTPFLEGVLLRSQARVFTRYSCEQEKVFDSVRIDYEQSYRYYSSI